MAWRRLAPRRPSTEPAVEPATILRRANGSHLENLPDDIVGLILALLPSAQALSAAACASRRLHALASDADSWRRLLLERLRAARWPLADLAMLRSVSKAEVVHMLLAKSRPRAWVLPRIHADTPGASSGAMSALPFVGGLTAASTIFATSASGFPAPTSNPFLLAAAAAAASIAFHQPIQQPAPAAPAQVLAPAEVLSHEDADAVGPLEAAPAAAAGEPPAPVPPAAVAPVPPPPPPVLPAETLAPAARERRLHVSVDGLTVRYVGDRLGGNRAVRCEPPLPTRPYDALRATAGDSTAGPTGASGGAKAVPFRLRLTRDCMVGYFEVTVGPRPPHLPSHMDCIAVGVGSASFPLTGRQPGWDAHSYGYHSDDGRLFHGSGTRSAPFGPRFGPGDTIGCGVCIRSRQIFYTLNGAFLGVGFVAKSSQLPLYPLVGLDSHAPVAFNFGQRPFHFDLEQLPMASRAKLGHAKPAASTTSPLRQIALAFSRG